MAAIITFLPPCLLLVFSLSYQLYPVASVDPTLKTPNITSSNNSHKANASSYIQWGDGPKIKSIELSNEEKSDGLEPLFKFSRSFIYTALNDKIPVDFIQKVRSNKLNIIDDLQKLIFNYGGFLAAIVVGIIFVILFPLIGLFFCLCRCCGNCGGKMIQSSKDNSAAQRNILAFLLFLGVAFSASGTAFMFASDARLMEKIKRTPETLPKVMTAVADFGDNTYKQVDFFGTETVNFLLAVINRDLDNLDVLIGIPLREKLDNKANVRAIFKTVRELSQDLNFLMKSMAQVKTGMQDVEDKKNILIGKTSQLQKDINDDFNKCKNASIGACQMNLLTAALTTTFSKKKLPDISNEITMISKVDLIGEIAQPEKKFEDIPELVHNKSTTKVQDVIRNLNDIKNTMIPKYLKLAKKFKTDLDAGKFAGQDLGMLTNKGNHYLDLVKPFNNIRSYVFIGLAGFCLFIIGLLFFGLVLGCCGKDDRVKPVDRGCVSNCGGCLLMGAVVIIFLSGWLLMLLTTAMFIPGAVIEVYGCKTLRRIGEGSVDKILKAVLKENPGKLLFKNSSFDVKISDIYNGCEKGEGLYKAAYLDYIVNFDKIFNYPQEMGIRKDLTAIKVDLSSIKILSPAMTTQLNDFQASMNIDFEKFKNELSKVPSPASLNVLILNLNAMSAAPAPYGQKFKTHADNVRAIQKKESQQLFDSKQKFSDTLVTLENSAVKTNKTINKLRTAMAFTQKVIDNNGSEIVKDVLNGFADRIFRIWDDFVKYMKDLLNNKLGKCRPITNIYDYVVIDTLCGIVDSFNAYWFGLGWCLFFLVFNIIIAVKLAKHFRRMKYSDELDGSKDEMQLHATTHTGRRGSFHHNKVGQMPRY